MRGNRVDPEAKAQSDTSRAWCDPPTTTDRLPQPAPELLGLWAQMGDAVVAFPDFDPVRSFQ